MGRESKREREEEEYREEVRKQRWERNNSKRVRDRNTHVSSLQLLPVHHDSLSFALCMIVKHSRVGVVLCCVSVDT